MTGRTAYPPRGDAHHLADDVAQAGGVEAVAERLGLSPEFVRECLVGKRDWPGWAVIQPIKD